jgi:uncharacterized protein (TIGR02391 family)
MQELIQAIPDVDVLLALEPEELGAKMLFLLKKRRERMFFPTTLVTEMWIERHGHPEYPRNRMEDISLAITEALAWLQAQGLIVPAPDDNGRNGWMVLSRRARKFQDDAEFANFATARLLDKAMLHPRLRDRTWNAFMRGEFDVAVFQAMKAVEVAVREAGGFNDGDLGTDLMRAAFHVDRGPLTDMKAEPGEREARSHLFAGAIGSYKNPNSHRDVQFSDPREAVEIVMLANHLLSIVDARMNARESETP